MLLTAGTCSVTASQQGNANYNAAPSITRTFTVSRAKPSGTLVAAAGSPFAVTNYPYNAGSDPSKVVAADFNGDGITDLATLDATGATVTVLPGNGAGGFSATPVIPFSTGGLPVGLVVGDFTPMAYQILL